MEINFTSPKEEVINFLLELREIISHSEFDANKDLDIILKKKNENSLDPYTTQNTLLKLDFDKNDIAETLKKLTKVFCISFHFARYPLSNFPYKY